MADTQEKEVATPAAPTTPDPINSSIAKYPFLKAQQKAGEKAVEAKVLAETEKAGVELGEKTKALEDISAKDKAKYEETKSQMKAIPEFKPSEENAFDFGAIFSMVATMGVALGGSGKLSGLNAMNAMSGMLKGYQQGRKDLFAKEQAIFDKEMSSIKAANDALIKDLEQYQKLSATDKEAAMSKAAMIAAKNPGVIKSLIESGRADVALDVAKANTKLQSEIIEKSIKTGVSGKGTLVDYIAKFTNSRVSEKDAPEIMVAANALGDAYAIKQSVADHPEWVGRTGQIKNIFNKTIESINSGSPEPDDEGQPELIFAKRYAEYLTNYERALAGGARGFTVQFQKRFNSLLDQNQFNAAGMSNLMDEQMRTITAKAAEKSPTLNRENLTDISRDLKQRSGDEVAIKGMGGNLQKTQAGQVDETTEREKARAAIAAGKDEDAVKALFKQKTGKDY